MSEAWSKVEAINKQSGRQELVPTKEPAKRSAPILPDPNDAGTWHVYFEHKLGAFLEQSRYGFQGLFGTAAKTVLPAADKWEPLLRHVFRLHLLLYLLQAVDTCCLRARERSNWYYFDYTLLDIQDRCESEFHDLLRTIQGEEAFQRFPRQMQAVADFLFLHGFGAEESKVDWMSYYTGCWGRWLFRDGLWQPERKRLERALAQEGMTQPQHNAYLIAMAHMDFMSGRDKEAIALLGQADTDFTIGSFLPYVHTHVRGKQWDKLLLWLRFLAPYVRNSWGNEVDFYSSAWMAGAAAQSDDHEWRELVLSLQPYLKEAYTDYLVERRDYSSWATLHLSSQTDPKYIHRSMLRKVEQEAPQVLLPLYHQSVERILANKRRDSYRDAARMLKKLASLYKKLKQMERWEKALDDVRKRYSRLRAFQEELRKGKLIS